MWLISEWTYPCFNVNNGRCMHILRWKNSKNMIFEEQTGRLIPILSFLRPHSRALHISWITLMICFCQWFSVMSMFPILQKPYCDSNCNSCTFRNISNEQCENCFKYDNKDNYGCGGIELTKMYLITILNSIGSIISRIIVGSLSDRYGVRYVYIGLILITLVGSIIHIINPEWIVYTSVINGLIGGSFVLSELWIMQMFDISILGIVAGIIGGLGNAGGGLVYLINGNIYDICIQNINIEYVMICSRICLMWPSLLLICLIFIIYKYADDCPLGTFQELKKYYEDTIHNTEQNQIDDLNLDDTIIERETVITDIDDITPNNIRHNLKNYRILILSFAYMIAFGLEVTLYSNLILYLQDNLSMSHKDTSNYVGIYGLITIIARPLGGFISDKLFNYYDFSGRIKFVSLTMFIKGIIGIIFAKNKPSIFIIVIWSIFTNLAEGAIFGLLSYVGNTSIGVNTSIIGSFGAIGALLGNIMYNLIGGYLTFRIFGYLGVISSVITMFVML